MQNNYLVFVSSPDILLKLSGESNVTFLFPIQDFTVGFPHPFSLSDIQVEHAYLFVNRILDCEGIERFKEIISKLPSNIEGIVFDDLGILEVLNQVPNYLTKILFLNHFNCNTISVNGYLEYVDSVVVSTDLTEEETHQIVSSSSKPVCLYTFGHVNIMYSRRRLITNYNEHFQKKAPLISSLTNDLKQEFKIVENEYGTVIYSSKPFNGLKYRKFHPVLFHLINPLFLEGDEVTILLHRTDDLRSVYPYAYLSEEETIVRIKERDL